MYRFCILIFIGIVLLSCNRDNKQQRDALSSKESIDKGFLLSKDELHSLVNGLIEGDSAEVDLLILQTGDVRKLQNYLITDKGDTIIDDSFPSPPWEFRYNKGNFYALVNEGHIDSLDAEFMFEQITPNLTISLDSSMLIRRGIDPEQLDKFFTEGDRALGFKKLEEELRAKNFVRLSTPLLNKSKTKAFISMNGFCGRLCGSGTSYLLEKKEGKWQVIYRQHRWVS